MDPHHNDPVLIQSRPGYNGIATRNNRIDKNLSGLDINTAGAFVDPKNVDAIAPLAAKEIR